MIVYEDDQRVGIVTFGSHNRKTGPMAQLWILYRHTPPLEAAQDGSDVHVCGSCPHRRSGLLGDCYVNLGQAPYQIYTVYKAGRYDQPPEKVVLHRISFGGLRLGAYGDPAFLPFELVTRLVGAALFHTAYTHQWRTCDQRFREFMMASTDTVDEVRQAAEMGWRSFRTHYGPPSLLPGEIICPEQRGGHLTGKVTCSTCQLCNGKTGPNIMISAHGPWSTAVQAVTTFATN